MCLDDQILNTYMDGELAEPWKSQVEEHLKHCLACSNRLDSIRKVSTTLKTSEISEDEIQSHQKRVLEILEKNYLGKKRYVSAFKKQVRLSVSQLIGVAAAFVVVFVGSWTLIGSKSDQTIPVPEVVPSIDIANITPARAVQQDVKSLDSYSLEEILQNLDARGFDVDIRLKGIKPIEDNSTSDITQ